MIEADAFNGEVLAEALVMALKFSMYASEFEADIETDTLRENVDWWGRNLDLSIWISFLEVSIEEEVIKFLWISPSFRLS